MKDDSWESFIEESVRQLGKENNYYQVLRLGGAGDKGRDVASYTLKEPAAGTWICIKRSTTKGLYRLLNLRAT